MSVIQGEDFDESSDIDQHEVRRNVDFLNNRGRAVVGPLYIENGEDFIFSYYDKAWLPIVPSQGNLRKYLASFPSIRTLLFLTNKSQTKHKNSTRCCLKEKQKLLSLIWWKSVRVLLKINGNHFINLPIPTIRFPSSHLILRGKIVMVNNV
ncbi:hypothetical protein QL285_056146 [Trifolium repens]|nr:hypothetical protein QL285_056146 [Trifolium repens]